MEKVTGRVKVSTPVAATLRNQIFHVKTCNSVRIHFTAQAANLNESKAI